jgi:hypothetical protein
MALGGVSAVLAIATVAMLIPTAAGAAQWQTRVFSASYVGNGSFNYSSKGSTTDTGCYMTMGVDSKYGFAQLWKIKAEFRRRAGGGWDSKVDSINHVDGPQAPGRSDSATLQGRQGKYQGDCYDARVKGPDTGVLDCSSGAPQLTAWTNPQMEITRNEDNLDMIGRAFLDAHPSYSGKDTIPTDVKYFHGCAHYDDDWTFGSTLIPGTYDTAKVAFGVHELATLAKGTTLKKPVSLGQNTLYKPQQVCDSTFGRPNFCMINSQSLKGGFQLSRVR